MALNKSKYHIRKGAVLVNKPASILFPKNAYYDLEDIISDIVDNTTGLDNYVPLNSTAAVTVTTNNRFSVLGENGEIKLKTDSATPGDITLEQDNGTDTGTIRLANATGNLTARLEIATPDPDQVSVFIVGAERIQSQVSSDISNQDTVIGVADELIALEFDDGTASSSKLEVAKDLISLLSNVITITHNNTDPDLVLTITMDEDAIEIGASETGVEEANVNVEQTGVLINYIDTVTPANNASILIESGFVTIVAPIVNMALPNYADDTAAGVAGLAAGDLYQTAGAVKIKQ